MGLRYIFSCGGRLHFVCSYPAKVLPLLVRIVYTVSRFTFYQNGNTIWVEKLWNALLDSPFWLRALSPGESHSFWRIFFLSAPFGVPGPRHLFFHCDIPLILQASSYLIKTGCSQLFCSLSDSYYLWIDLKHFLAGFILSPPNFLRTPDLPSSFSTLRAGSLDPKSTYITQDQPFSPLMMLLPTLWLDLYCIHWHTFCSFPLRKAESRCYYKGFLLMYINSLQFIPTQREWEVLLFI